MSDTTDPTTGGEDGLGERLLAADGLDDPAASNRRKRAMRQLLEQERRFTRRLRTACIVAWALSVLLPLGYIAQYPLGYMVSNRGDTGLSASVMLYFGAQFLVFVGAVAVLVGAITLVAWLFRTRRVSDATLQLRVTELEETLAELRRERSG